MLISLSFTTAESVAVAFNQKTQYDGIWQALFSHLNATTGAKAGLTFWSKVPVGGSVALLHFFHSPNGLCSGSTLIN